MLRKCAGVVAGVVILSGTMFMTTAGATGTKNFKYTAQTSGDSSTCGPDWANDNFDREYKVTKQQNINGSYRVTVTYMKATFTTIAGPSPESCEAGDSNTVTAGVTGRFTGSEILNVTGGTFNAAPACATNCSTDAFVAAAFGPSATYTFADYFFEYGIHKNQGCGIDWVDAQTGDGGDIATTCAP
jgi:hypothetical protein